MDSPREIRILVVDDSGATREMIRAGLSLHGYTVSVAQNGKEGLETFLKIQPHAVICDLYMPEMDGIAFCRALRQQGFKTPLLFLTSDQSPYRMTEGMASGADVYVTKPVDSNALHRHLQDLLKRSSPDPS